MLYAIKPQVFDIRYGCDFEVEFAAEKEGMASVFVRDFDGNNTYKTLVGHVSRRDAMKACALDDAFEARLESAKTPVRLYRDTLPLVWARKNMLKYCENSNCAIVLIAGFRNSVCVSQGVMGRKPRYFGGFGLVELRSGEMLSADGRNLIYDGNTLRIPFDVEIDKNMVNCSSILNHSAILGTAISLF